MRTERRGCAESVCSGRHSPSSRSSSLLLHLLLLLLQVLLLQGLVLLVRLLLAVQHALETPNLGLPLAAPLALLGVRLKGGKEVVNVA
jgi:hypothetical protein